MPFLKIHSTLPCKCFVFFDYVGEQWGVSFCFQTIKHELGFRKRVVSTVEHRRGGKYPFRGHPTSLPDPNLRCCCLSQYRNLLSIVFNSSSFIEAKAENLGFHLIDRLVHFGLFDALNTYLEPSHYVITYESQLMNHCLSRTYTL